MKNEAAPRFATVMRKNQADFLTVVGEIGQYPAGTPRWNVKSSNWPVGMFRVIQPEIEIDEREPAKTRMLTVRPPYSTRMELTYLGGEYGVWSGILGSGSLQEWVLGIRGPIPPSYKRALRENVGLGG